MKWECPDHPGSNTVIKTLCDLEHLHVTFGCGCTVEFPANATDGLPGLEVGDAVLWCSELFRLESINEDYTGEWCVITNKYGKEEVRMDDLDYVAKDTLSTTVPQKNWEISTGDGYKKEPWYKPKQKNSRAEKKDNISTSSLINDEVNTLKNEKTSTRRLKTNPPKGIKDTKENKVVPIKPRRKGDW